MTTRSVTRAGAALICTMFLTAVGAAPVVTAEAGVNPSSLVPATHLRGAVCVVSGDNSISSSPGRMSPSVLAHPSAVDIVWLPGLNSRACKAVLTRGTAHIASTLTSDIDGARVVPNADTYMCPDDDGTGARLYFMYADGATQRIDADLSGCSWITAPGDGARSSTSMFRQDMSILAPRPWRSYLAPDVDRSG
jgi:hypothetical protein